MASQHGRAAKFQLRTLGEVALIGASGPVPLGEPQLVALLALLAVGGDGGVSEEELQFARQTAALRQRVPTLMLEAEAFRAMGQADSVRVTLSRLLSESSFGFEGQDDWLRAPLILGDLLVAQGDSAEGMKAYERLLAQWRDAPATVPDVVAARARVASLSSTHQ